MINYKAYLKTEINYNHTDVVLAFHAMLECGEIKLRKDGHILYADIISDLRANAPILKRE